MVDQTLPPTPGLSPRDPHPAEPGPTTLGHVIYALYALGFVTGFTPLVGVVMAYLNREDARGNWLETHYVWQIRTFWYGVLMQVVGWITVWILIGWAILGLATVWFVWRIAKGWIRLANGAPVEDCRSFL